MIPRARALLLLSLLSLALPGSVAHASGGTAAAWAQTAYRPGEVVVRMSDGRTRVRPVAGGRTVLEEAERLARRPDVASAGPNWIARASAFVPNDPGESGEPGGWQQTQWNLLPVTGIDAPAAWENLIAAGKPGGKGVVVAVLDTGVAYRNLGRKFRRSPDLAPERFRRGYDFVDDDAYPLDHNGHGTHVTSTIAETANNGIALVGIAYGARILPVRVLDRLGEGDSYSISRGIRFAARRGAKIINLSFEFSSTVRPGQIPEILGALRYARRRGALVVAASGNASATAVAYPARASDVLSVGAVTEHGCQAGYSNTGRNLDLVAPGGGPDAPLSSPSCRPDEPPGRDILQMTFLNSARRFGLPTGYVGTSMATPHVSATAALIVASGVLGDDPSPAQITARLKTSATDLGAPGADARYGAGLINAGRATAPDPASSPPAQ